MDGWIKIHRQITENPYYFSEAFTRGQAWVDMLIIANHREGFFYKRGIKVVVSRGQIGYDVDTLSKRWKWSRGKVERFFSELEKDSQIVRQKNNVTTLISIINYDLYQGDDKANSEADGQQTANQTSTNKNDKKKKKRIEADFLPPSELEVTDYFIQNGFTLDLGIKAFNYYSGADWKDSKGNKVKNWKQKMIGVWFKEENKIQNKKGQKPNGPGGAII
jgi:hypothetical protein